MTDFSKILEKAKEVEQKMKESQKNKTNRSNWYFWWRLS